MYLATTSMPTIAFSSNVIYSTSSNDTYNRNYLQQQLLIATTLLQLQLQQYLLTAKMLQQQS